MPTNAISPKPLLYCAGADNPAAAAPVELLVADDDALGDTVLAALSFSRPAVIVTGSTVCEGIVAVVSVPSGPSMVSMQSVGFALLVLHAAVTIPVLGTLISAL